VAKCAPNQDLAAAMKDSGRAFTADPVVCEAICDVEVGKAAPRPRSCGRCATLKKTVYVCTYTITVL
jgi:hypothetical protein